MIYSNCLLHFRRSECAEKWLNSNDSVPIGSEADIGRKVLRKSSSGWAAVGVVVGFKEMKEARTQKGPAVEGEIGDTCMNLFEHNHDDKWTVQYGSGNSIDLGIADLIYGFQLYQKVLATPELRDSYGE